MSVMPDELIVAPEPPRAPVPEPPDSLRGLALQVLAFFAIAVVGQNLDLLTKQAAFDHLAERDPVTREWEPIPGKRVEAMPGLLQFEATTNKGIVFGLGQQWGTAFTVVSVLAVPLIVAIFWSVKTPRLITTVSLGLILAGTLGNMYDRLAEGMVRDFIKVHPDLIRFPLFNLADSFICVGVFLMIADILVFDSRDRKRRAKDAPRPGVSPPPAS